MTKDQNLAYMFEELHAIRRFKQMIEESKDMAHFMTDGFVLKTLATHPMSLPFPDLEVPIRSRLGGSRSWMLRNALLEWADESIYELEKAVNDPKRH